MTFGNYDAGQSKPVSNPYLDAIGKYIKPEQLKNIADGIGLEFKTDDIAAFKLERTTNVTPEQRIENDAQVTYATVTGTLGNPDVVARDMAYDEMLTPFITEESRNAGTSARMGFMNDFEYIFGIPS